MELTVQALLKLFQQLNNSNEKPVQLTNSDNSDKWFLKNGESKYVRFDFNADGRAKTINIVDMLIIPRH